MRICQTCKEAKPKSAFKPIADISCSKSCMECLEKRKQKACVKCNQVKPLKEFFGAGTRTQSYCKACFMVYQTAYREAEKARLAKSKMGMARLNGGHSSLDNAMAQEFLGLSAMAYIEPRKERDMKWRRE